MRMERDIKAANIHPVVRRLTEIRVAWQLTGKDVAKRIGCSLGTLQHIEAGLQQPSFKLLVRWAEVMGYQLNLWPKDAPEKNIAENCGKMRRAAELVLEGAA